jgi:hypothetical protein
MDCGEGTARRNAREVKSRAIAAEARKPMSEQSYTFRTLPTTNDPLWPPKPKLFDMATEKLRGRA